MSASVLPSVLLGVFLYSLVSAGFGPAPGVLGPRPGHAWSRPGSTATVLVWAVPGLRARRPSPPSPNFLPTSRPAPLGAPLRFPHELFSSSRSNQHDPAP